MLQAREWNIVPLTKKKSFYLRNGFFPCIILFFLRIEINIAILYHIFNMHWAILYIVILGFMSGVMIRSFTYISFITATLALVIGLSIIIVCYFIKRDDQILKSRDFKEYNSNEKAHTIFFITAISLFLISSAFGIARYHLSDIRISNALEQYVGQKSELQAMIVDEPDIRENHQLITLEIKCGAENMNIPCQYFKVIPRILVITELYPIRRYGDIVKVSGEIIRVGKFEQENGRIFDYPAYLAKDGIYYRMNYPTIDGALDQGGSIIKRNLYAIKNVFMERVRESLPEPHSSLLGGLLLGIKQSLGKDLLDQFRSVGLIHIVVLSGYNITIIADFVGRIFLFMRSFYVRLYASAFSIIGFVILTGASATALRAGIMALLAMLAVSQGREYNITRALFVAGFLMILFNPKTLAFDPSFQLSFLATFSLIALAPLVEVRLGGITNKWKLREIITTTVSTQLFVLPLLLYMTGKFSLVSLPVNLLTLIAIPATMLMGFITALVSFIHHFFALPFAWATYLLLEWELLIVRLFSSFSISDFSVGLFPFWGVIASYIFLGILIFTLQNKNLLSKYKEI
jgi:competence protein ComEC